MTLKSLNKKCCSLASKMTNYLKGDSCPEQVYTLAETCHCGRMKICKIEGDRQQCARMTSMGVYAGKEFDLICPEKGSSCILRIGGGTISLDKDTTKTILVTPV